MIIALFTVLEKKWAKKFATVAGIDPTIRSVTCPFVTWLYLSQLGYTALFDAVIKFDTFSPLSHLTLDEIQRHHLQ